MDLESVVKLRKIEAQLVEDVDFESISPGLLQYKVISNEEYCQLSKKDENSEKVKHLVAALYKKGSFAIESFSEALEEDYDWLAHTLKNTVVTQREIEEYKTAHQQTNQHPAHNISVTPAQHQSQTYPLPSNSSSLSPPLDNLPQSLPLFNPLANVSRSPASSVSSGHNPVSSPAYSGSNASTTGSSDLNSPQHSHGFHSPLHSSEFSISSSPGPSSSPINNTGQGLKRKSDHQEREDEEISEEMIEFVMANPRVMRGYTKLAHQAGLTSRLPVIKMRIMSEMRDHDEFVAEILREWKERSPGDATRVGLVKILRALNFNDTAMKIEDGSFNKKKRI